MSEQPNPFAAPQSDPTTLTPELPALHNRMPGSVMLAVGATGVIVVLNLMGLVGVMLGGIDLAALIATLVPLAIGGLVLLGLIRRSRLARQWGRIIGLLLALLMTLYLAITVAGFIFIMSSDYYNEMNNDDPVLIMLPWAALAFAVAMIALPAILLWAIFIALGRPTARQYFNLICPRCNAHRTKAANFFFTRAKCKECAEVW